MPCKAKPRIATTAYWSTSRACAITAGLAERATCRSCQSTRGSSTRLGLPLRPTPSTLTRRTSSDWPSRAGAMASSLRSARWASCRAEYAHKIPFFVKLNHNELLTYPNRYDQRMFASVDQAWDLGAAGVGATVYFGSEESLRQIEEVSQAFARAHELGLFTVLWCYLRNAAFKTEATDYHLAADMTNQANHLGVTIEADLIKQKLPTCNGGFQALNFGRTHALVYGQLTSSHPIDLTRYQVAGCYMGRIGMINSGGPRTGRSAAGGGDRGDQQAGGRQRPDQRQEGLSAAYEGWHRPVARDTGRVLVPGGRHRLTGRAAACSWRAHGSFSPDHQAMHPVRSSRAGVAPAADGAAERGSRPQTDTRLRPCGLRQDNVGRCLVGRGATDRVPGFPSTSRTTTRPDSWPTWWQLCNGSMPGSAGRLRRCYALLSLRRRRPHSQR